MKRQSLRAVAGSEAREKRTKRDDRKKKTGSLGGASLTVKPILLRLRHRSKATSAHLDALCPAFLVDNRLLNVRREGTLGAVHRMADVVAAHRSLPADLALSHVVTSLRPSSGNTRRRPDSNANERPRGAVRLSGLSDSIP